MNSSVKSAESKKQHQLMTETSIPVLITKMSLPMIVSQLISVVYNAVDTWFVAQISTCAAAAVGIVFTLMSLIQAIGFALGMGANSIISRLLGEKKDEEAHRIASSAVMAGLILGTLLTLILMPLLTPFMKLIGSSPNVLPYSLSYSKCILYAAPVMCMSFIMLNILRAQGKTQLAMWALCFGAILNTILDPLLIFRCKMGIFGAALATVLGQTASFCLLLLLFFSGKSFVQLRFKWISLDGRTYGQIITTGMPTVFRQGLGGLATALLNVAAMPFGDAAVAAISITNKIYLILRHLVIGIGQGFQPVAGYNYGAGCRERVREAFRFTVITGTLLCVILAAGIGLFAENILTAFIADRDVIRIGTNMLYFIASAVPLMAYSTFVNQMYQCLGFKWQATFLASCRQGIFFIPLVFTLPGILGLIGIELLQPTADILTFIVSIPFQIHFYNRHLNDRSFLH